MKAQVAPLGGKHYGTSVWIDLDGEQYAVSVWIPHGQPSDAERAMWSDEPDICDEHYQSEIEARVAQLIVDAINSGSIA